MRRTRGDAVRHSLVKVKVSYLGVTASAARQQLMLDGELPRRAVDEEVELEEEGGRGLRLSGSE